MAVDNKAGALTVTAPSCAHLSKFLHARMSATLGLNAFKLLSLEQGGEQRVAGENNQNKSGVE